MVMVGVAVLCKLFYGSCDVVVRITQQAHLCGMMSDLPNHVSTKEEITEAIGQLHNWLEQLSHPPTMITIAR